MNQFQVTAEPRKDTGKGASRRLRHTGKVPAILYGGNKDPQPLTLVHHTFANQLENESFYSHLLTIKTGDETEQVILKALQRHPSKPIIMHADFQRITKNTKVRMHIPLHFSNEDICPGVKTGGGVISHQLKEVEIECLPDALPEFINLDLADLQLDQAVHLSDLSLPDGVKLSALIHGTVRDLPVVTVHRPRIQQEEEEAAAAEEGTEAEAVTEEKEEKSEKTSE
ncbi:MAG: 50S ribosomal protein L25/general stress protein Ctc [Gammaproteobacteria bacterium]|nr:50S ribosomal protein L25/general stress protein Ctc [Gammaproteobacteria bacterium]